ncbi:hypothetical protein LWI29_008352 [Acer saccharum]|uniref:Uncharacterized protein n=1 Tax=Acer saccharum TaxID=4024 RepID=A0AA39S1X8_ACESA|nr:hypothetical protein LWI29_008352 [Acer saccharum]
MVYTSVLTMIEDSVIVSPRNSSFRENLQEKHRKVPLNFFNFYSTLAEATLHTKILGHVKSKISIPVRAPNRLQTSCQINKIKNVLIIGTKLTIPKMQKTKALIASVSICSQQFK